MNNLQRFNVNFAYATKTLFFIGPILNWNNFINVVHLNDTHFDTGLNINVSCRQQDCGVHSFIKDDCIFEKLWQSSEWLTLKVKDKIKN